MKRILAPLALILAAGCVSTPPPPVWRALPAASLDRELSLDEALSLARESDVRLATWAARREAARAGLVTAAAMPNPTFALEWEGLGLRDAGRSIASLKMGVSYPFLAFLPRPHRIAAAQGDRAVEEESLRAEGRMLVAEVGSAWFGLLADQRRSAIATALSQNAREAVALAVKAREAGVRSTYEVERAEAEALEASGDEAAAVSQLRLDQLAFAFALGTDRPAFPRAIEPKPLAQTDPRGQATPVAIPDDLLAMALTSDPDYAKAHAAVCAAEAALHVEQFGAFPFTGVTGGAGRKSEPGLGGGGTGSLEVPIPLFDRNQGGIAKARAALAVARAEEEASRRSVISTLASDWERVRGASARLDRFAHPLTLLRRKTESSARSLYAAGQIDQSEWLQAQRDLKSAEKAEVDAWKDAEVAKFTLEAALGRHDPRPR